MTKNEEFKTVVTTLLSLLKTTDTLSDTQIDVCLGIVAELMNRASEQELNVYEYLETR